MDKKSMLVGNIYTILMVILILQNIVVYKNSLYFDFFLQKMVLLVVLVGVQ